METKYDGLKAAGMTDHQIHALRDMGATHAAMLLWAKQAKLYEIQAKRQGPGETWRSDAVGLNEPRGYAECEIDIAILRQLPQEDGWQTAEYRIVEAPSQYDVALCGQCGTIHTPPACTPPEEWKA